jgi:UDP-2-acetamido-2-deoxy-ribo-hexuluronate aminotransferase
LKAAITPRTKAVITVDLYGNMADYETILPIAARRGIRVIEDCAEAAGATYKGAQAAALVMCQSSAFMAPKRLPRAKGECY